ncbi:hypothetical protein [Psychrobacter sp. ANT_H56B]|nr:hypothetical protein [Psychrobacter sp. ANT_H56B]
MVLTKATVLILPLVFSLHLAPASDLSKQSSDDTEAIHGFR